MKKLIAGNWKMNGTVDEAKSLIADIVNGIHEDESVLERCEFLVCPPFVHIPAIRHSLHNIDHITFGGQDCSVYDDGAYTGDISASILKDSGCSYVILGHSERRQHFGETDEVVASKASKAHKAGLTAIICVGESEEEREEGKEQVVVEKQLRGSVPGSATADNTVIAYEPVWAIGTGKTATAEDVKAMHAFIRHEVGDLRILYGGSMKPDNSGELLATENVDGGLLGGASLNALDYLAIAKSA